jgi:hypothetical protein
MLKNLKKKYKWLRADMKFKKFKLKSTKKYAEVSPNKNFKSDPNFLMFKCFKKKNYVTWK